MHTARRAASHVRQEGTGPARHMQSMVEIRALQYEMIVLNGSNDQTRAPNSIPHQSLFFNKQICKARTSRWIDSAEVGVGNDQQGCSGRSVVLPTIYPIHYLLRDKLSTEMEWIKGSSNPPYHLMSYKLCELPAAVVGLTKASVSEDSLMLDPLCPADRCGIRLKVGGPADVSSGTRSP